MSGISEKIGLIDKSPIRRVTALLAEVRKRRDIISFGGGAPSLVPPREVVDETLRKLDGDPQRVLSYTGTRGLGELLRLIGQDLKKSGGVDLDLREEIIVTSGSTEGILLALMAVLDPGDEVIIADPTYLGYPEAIKVAGGTIVRLPVHVGEGFQPDPERLKEKITEKTTALILLSPDNPTGRIIEKNRAKAIVDLAVDHDFWILCDDAYKDIIYEGRHVWVSELPGARDHTITVCTFSKSASVPGFRLGYAYGPREVIDAMEKLKQYTTLCPNTLGQLAMIRFLSGSVKERYIREVIIPAYKSRRDVMGRAIKRHLPKGETVTPHGAFYFFVNMEAYLDALNVTDERFCDELLEKKSVVGIPGAHFGANGERHLRLTFVSESPEKIKTGIAKVGEFLEERGVA